MSLPRWLQRALGRVPVRRRLVAGFVAVMLIVLAAAGSFVYWRVQSALDERLDSDLAGAAKVLLPEITQQGQLPINVDVVNRIDGYQVIDRGGVVVGHDERLGAAAVLRRGQVARALQRPHFFDVGEVLTLTRKPLRLYAVPFTRDGQQLVLVIALHRGEEIEALRQLLFALVLAGIGAMALTALVGDRLARAALRPVESYRARAAAIAAGVPGLRLDVPEGRDDEVTRLGHTLNEMLASLDEAIARERRFVDDASHELRTPLTLLTARVQLLQRRARSVAEHEAALVEIREDVARLAALVEQLLDVGRQQRANADEPAVRGDLATAAMKAVELRVALAAPGSAYAAPGALAVAATPPVVVGIDDVTLVRVVDNLLDNAANHGRPPVTVTVDAVDGVARLLVADAGGGMPDELLRRATERFARSDDARRRPGSGLGLSLVATAVTSAGGEVRLCHAGRHHSVGHPLPVACDHGEAMTVSVLLPRV